MIYAKAYSDGAVISLSYDDLCDLSFFLSLYLYDFGEIIERLPSYERCDSLKKTYSVVERLTESVYSCLDSVVREVDGK